MPDGKLLMSGAAPGWLVSTQLAALAYPSGEGSWGTWTDATAPSHGLGGCVLKHSRWGSRGSQGLRSVQLGRRQSSCPP